MHPSFTLVIGDRVYTASNIVEAVEKDRFPGEMQWQRSVVSFLKQWFNEDEDILAHTSGSTGEPRVIRLSKARMRISASMTCDYFGLKPRDRALLCLSAENIAGRMMLVRAMERGLHLDAVSPAGCPLSNTLEKVKFAAMVPLQVQHCLDRGCLDQAETILLGGAAVSDKMQDMLFRQEVKCYCSYGMTETMSHVALKKLNGPDASEWYEGLADARFDLDERDCLQITSAFLGIEKLQTNDICELDGQTRFRWLGRLDFVINSGGLKVSPEQLEKLLSPYMHLPYFITGLPDEELGERIVLFIEASSPDRVPLEQIQRAFGEWHKYKRPKAIYVVSQFVYTVSGKINRNATKAKERLR
ncbi:MAG: AMP-binding protein, partial [Bacteroidota bacterium]|nr:AMP-binding protein [Bacteroidota bacterium]